MAVKFWAALRSAGTQGLNNFIERSWRSEIEAIDGWNAATQSGPQWRQRILRKVQDLLKFEEPSDPLSVCSMHKCLPSADATDAADTASIEFLHSAIGKPTSRTYGLPRFRVR
jgi:hypothetical protein